ncbi:MAG: hypothetical protein J0M19_10295 [Sphingomonadales bacterium]|nr:hypothetical protein [Sphingomonadales bacterium]
MPAGLIALGRDPAAWMLVSWLLILPYAWRLGTWVERACAIGIGVRLAISVALILAFGIDHPTYPSPPLLAGLDFLTLSYFMGIVLVSDRYFVLFIAAASLIGLVSHLVMLSGFAPDALDLLSPSRIGGSVMLAALAAGTFSQARRRSFRTQ